MKHEYSLAHLTVLTLTPPQVVEAAAAAGYEYVSLRCTRVTSAEPLYDLGRDRALMRETKARLADTGIRMHDMELFRMDPMLEPEDFEPELDATAELGAHHIIAQLPDPDRGRAVARFARLCQLARPRGIFVSLEFPHWTETGDLAEAARVVREAGQDNSGILIDMLHMGRSNSSVEELRRLPREWFRFAHVCDAEERVPETMDGIIRTARDERAFPGEGTIDVKGILAALPDDIPYSLEIPRNVLTAAVGPFDVARIALRACQSYLDGLHWQDRAGRAASPAGAHAAGTPVGTH
jgi:sugar phosphate isomerase/epimerase